MRALIQRVSHASVSVDQQVISSIDKGFLVLLGVTHDDDDNDIALLVRKIANLRVFEDENSKMNLSLKDVSGCILCVSQFTLHADTKKGNRPSFTNAAKPEQAEALYNRFNASLRLHNITVKTGVFGAMMEVSLVNDGPVTIIIDSKDR